MTINYTTGYAGTGKSTRLLELLKTVPTTTVVICPTHKAIARLKSQVPAHLEIKTIHSLLGWIPTINENAEHVNHIDSTAKLDRELDDYTTIVIDEAGMMSEEMFMEITAKLEAQNDFETEHLTLHLFLDPYQLLPVKGKQIEIDPLTTTNLTTQHRAESPDVVELFTKFVNYLEGTNKSDLSVPFSDNVIHTNTVDDFKLGDRLLAYTNKRVGYYNEAIAKKFGITTYIDQEVQLGSMLDLVKCRDFRKPTLRDLINWFECGTLKLQNSQINKKFLEQSLQALLDHKDIEFMRCENDYIYPVIKGIGNAYQVRNKAKEMAVKDKKQFKWVYALNRAYTLDYAFASTVHKAQGSEFDTVWVDKEDIQKSIMQNYYDNYARLMYVAISRAKRKVYIL